MKLRIAYGTVGGSVTVPASAGYARRLLTAAALCDRPTVFTEFGRLPEEMTLPALLPALGAVWKPGGDEGKDATVIPATKLPSSVSLSCPAADAVFAVPALLARGIAGEAVFPAGEDFPTVLTRLLAAHGASFTAAPGRLAFSGRADGGDYRLSPEEVPLLPTLLEALALTGKPCRVSFTDALPESVAVGLDMTLDALAAFGCEPEQTEDGFSFAGGQRLRSPGTLPPEGDWEEAAVWLCAGALSKKGITVRGLNLTTSQPSRAVLNLMAVIGAAVRFRGSHAGVTRAGRYAFETDAGACPALTAALAAVAALCEGESRIYGCENAAALAEGICALGGHAAADGDDLCVTGVARLAGGALTGEAVLPLALLGSMMSDGEIHVTLPDSLSPLSRRLLSAFAGLGGRAEPVS